MLCYRDKSWCSSYLRLECVNHNCNRAFTEQDREYAKQWWGGSDFPLAVGEFKEEGCGFVPKSDEVNGVA